MLYTSYGNYTHGLSARGDAGFSIDREPFKLRDQITNGGYDETWAIRGMLYNSGGNVQRMRRMIAALEAAYAIPGQDLMLTDNGQLTHHYLRSIDCLGGTKIIRPVTYPTTFGPENITKRTFNVTVGGRVVTAAAATLVRYQERFAFSGGGPEYGHMVSRNARAVKILKTRFVPYRAIQSGSATGYGEYPEIPAPLWPWALLRPEDPGVSYEIGESFGGVLINKTVSWNYEYESIQPLIGLPSYFQ